MQIKPLSFILTNYSDEMYSFSLPHCLCHAHRRTNEKGLSAKLCQQALYLVKGVVLVLCVSGEPSEQPLYSAHYLDAHEQTVEYGEAGIEQAQCAFCPCSCGLYRGNQFTCQLADKSLLAVYLMPNHGFAPCNLLKSYTGLYHILLCFLRVFHPIAVVFVCRQEQG